MKLLLCTLYNKPKDPSTSCNVYGVAPNPSSEFTIHDVTNLPVRYILILQELQIEYQEIISINVTA